MTDVNKTTSTGLAMIEKDNVDINLQILQLKEIGIKITLQGIAESQVQRISKLNSVMQKIEEDIFDPEVIESLTDAGKIERYQLLQTAIGTLTNSAKANINHIDWAGMEIKLQAIRNSVDLSSNPEDNSDKKQLTTMASDLLKELSGGGFTKKS